MIGSFLFGVFILQPPHLAKSSCSGTLNRINTIENCLQIEPRITAYYTDIHTLSVTESIGDFRHCKTLTFSSPIVELNLKVMAPLYSPVFFRFCCGPFTLPYLYLDLFLQILHSLKPTERLDTFHNINMVG